ncbi:MAG: hypothetical protein TUN42_07925 [Dehalogenimonas sp.]
MTVRIWHGWTPPKDDHSYENLLKKRYSPESSAGKSPGIWESNS